MDWRKSYEDGLAAFKAKDYVKSVRLLNEVCDRTSLVRLNTYSLPCESLQSLNLGGKRFAVLDVRAAAFEKLLEYDKAMKDCRDCIVLDPKSNKSYLRASRICENRQQPEKALKFLEHAIQVTPASQVDPYLKRLAVLQGLVECLQPQVTRIDPITVLPEELLALVFEMAIAEDSKMAPRFSWVSRTWREMTINCPFLWRRVFLNGARLSQSLKRLQVYGQRGQGKLDDIHITRLTAQSESMIPAVRPFLRRVKALTVSVDEPTSLGTFVSELQHTCHHLEQLDVRMGPVVAPPRFPPQLHLGFVAPSASSTLRSVRLTGIHCGNTKIDGIVEEVFDNLEDVILNYCWISPDELVVPGQEEPVPSDIVHRSLRQAKNLKRLEILVPKFGGEGMPKEYSSDPITMEKLQLLVIPPPNEWAISAVTPSVRHFGMSRDMMSTWATSRNLLPSLKQLAPTQIPVSDLETLKIIVNDNDKSAALKSWLMRLNKVVELNVSSETPCREDGAAWGVDVHLVQPMLEAANNKIVSILHGRQEWCPQMRSLQLAGCLVPPREIMEYVKSRRTSPTLQTIRDLTLEDCSILPAEAEMWLQRNVENFKVIKTPKIGRTNWRGRSMWG
jgi:hypothetical protein